MTVCQVSLGKLKGDRALVAKGKAEVKKSEAEEKTGEEEEKTGKAEVTKGKVQVEVYPLVLPMPVSAGGAVPLPHPLAVRLHFSTHLFLHV